MVDVDDVKNYCRFWMNTYAQEIRRSGVRCSDKEFTIPAMLSLEKILGEVDVGDFFDNDYVAGYGLSLADCIEHTDKMKGCRDAYLAYRDFEEHTDG
jgi:hypothetical protein